MPDPLDDAIDQLRTASQVAEQFGITSQQLRRLAKLRGVGHRIGTVQVFTPRDVAALTVRRPGRRSTFALKRFKSESESTQP